MEDNNVVVSKQPKKLPIKILAIVIVLIILIAAGIYLYIRHKDNTNSVSYACSSQEAGNILNQAVSNLKAEKTSALATEVATIKTIPNYQEDPNCMYVLTSYYVSSYDISSAQSSLNGFNKVYNGQNVKPVLLGYLSVSMLRASVASMSNRVTQVEKNANELSPNQGGV